MVEPLLASDPAIFFVAAIALNCSHGWLGAVFPAPQRRAGRLVNSISSIVFGGLAAKLVID